MSKEIAVQGELGALPQETVDDTTALVQLAVERGVDVDVLERLVALKERVEARDARSAYFAALAAFQREVPEVQKSRAVSFDERRGGNVAFYFAPLEDIEKAVRPVALKHGLSWSFDSRMDEGLLTATCKVVHVQGHSETASFSAPVAKQAKMNQIQATGSTRSYAKRYALIDALGLSIVEMDDDAMSAGEAGGGEVITPHQAAELVSLMDEVGADRERFYAFMGIGVLEDLTQTRLPDAIAALERKR
jgi:hypothetical protein